MEAAGFRPGDRLVSVGDLVARGPDTHGVLALMRQVGARAVLGNHEERLLAVREARRTQEEPPLLGPSHQRLMEELSEEDWAWLGALPRHLELPEHGVRVVHAGVVPGLPFEEQDPKLLTKLRTLSPEGVPSSKVNGRLWGEAYRGAPHIVFGHHALASLQLHPDATGLDSACVYGGRLTALVLAAGQPVPPVERRADSLIGVEAARVYYVPSGK